MSNLERLLLSGARPKEEEIPEEKCNGDHKQKFNGHLTDNVLNYSKDLEKTKKEMIPTVQLMGVKSLDLVHASTVLSA